MASPLWDVFAAERSAGWSGVAGSRLEIEVPVRQAAIDWLLSAWPRPAAVEDLRITLGDGNRLAVEAVGVFLGFRKQFDLTLRVAPEMDRANGAHVVHLVIEDAALLSALLAVVSPAVPLPAGITLDPPQIAIDLDRAAAGTPGADVVPHLATLAFDGTRDALWIRAGFEVRETQAGTVPPLPPMRGAAGRPLPPIDEILEWVQGATATWRLRVAERLANMAVHAALQRAQQGDTSQTAPPPIAGALVNAVRGLQVAFEPGIVVVEGDAALGDTSD